MNKLLKYTLCFIVLIGNSPLLADEIYLTNGKVLYGEIKSTSADKLIYKDSSTFHALEISLHEIQKIVFAGGVEVNPKMVPNDRIHKKDGTIQLCKILRIQESSVTLLMQSEIIPRVYPSDEIERIVFENGTVLSFGRVLENPATNPTNIGNENQKQHNTPTHHIDEKFNVFAFIAGGFGINKNPDITTYSEELAERYRIHLENTYGLSGYKTEKGDSELNFDINVEGEMRVFSDSGYGAGLLAGLCFPIFMPIEIIDPNGEGVLQVNPVGVFLYAFPSVYYKYYFSTYNAMAFYFLVGGGAGICKGKVKFIIIEGYSNQNIGTPDAALFEKSYSGNSLGFIGTFEIGIEENNIILLLGVRIRHATISPLTDGETTMLLNNGEKAVLKFNGAFIYAGIGLFM
ncbi:MAG: hypothetical protein N2316_07705 [Spirochaetes bacterium]|nr:hypothetical protein [Spirochaetota bacterium]